MRGVAGGSALMLIGADCMNQAIVFLDGKYLQLVSNHFSNSGNRLKYDLNQLAITLAKREGLWCSKVYYYTAPPYQSEKPTPEEISRRSNHDRFTNKLKKIPNFFVREGRCQKVDGDYHQKGVDTLITMDLLTEASANKGMAFILVSCDTDFVPVIREIREKFGISVILYYYNDYVRKSKFSMSNHILTVCDRCILMAKDIFLTSAFPKNNQK